MTRLDCLSHSSDSIPFTTVSFTQYDASSWCRQALLPNKQQDKRPSKYLLLLPGLPHWFRVQFIPPIMSLSEQEADWLWNPMKCRDPFGNTVYWKLVKRMSWWFGDVFTTTAVYATSIIQQPLSFIWWPYILSSNMWTSEGKVIFYFDLHRLFSIQSLAPPLSWVFAENSEMFDVALKERFVSFVLIFCSFFLIPSSDVFDCEHVPYSTRMHSTNNSLAGKKKERKLFQSAGQTEKGFGSFVHHCVGEKKWTHLHDGAYFVGHGI